LTPDWRAGDGGELVLKPFLGQDVVVPPSLMTIAMFRSDIICHRVRTFARNTERESSSRKAAVTRYCFTLWFDGTSTNTDEDVNIRVKHLTESFVGELRKSPLQRTLSRLLYNEEYEEALVECFGSGTKEHRLSLAMHHAHCKAITQNQKVIQFVEQLRKIAVK
jgi:hypothetical protein